MLKLSSLVELNELLIQNPDKIICLDFWATWCKPCNDIAPKYNRLEELYNNIAIFCKVDVGGEEDISEEFDIKQIPTFAAYYQGIKVLNKVNFNDLELYLQNC